MYALKKLPLDLSTLLLYDFCIIFIILKAMVQFDNKAKLLPYFSVYELNALENLVMMDPLDCGLLDI
jgi:hypothetical protein